MREQILALDAYETARPPRRGRSQMRIPKDVRHDILMNEWAVSFSTIQKTIISVNKEREQRSKTQRKYTDRKKAARVKKRKVSSLIRALSCKGDKGNIAVISNINDSIHHSVDINNDSRHCSSIMKSSSSRILNQLGRKKRNRTIELNMEHICDINNISSPTSDLEKSKNNKEQVGECLDVSLRQTIGSLDVSLRRALFDDDNNDENDDSISEDSSYDGNEDDNISYDNWNSLDVSLRKKVALVALDDDGDADDYSHKNQTVPTPNGNLDSLDVSTRRRVLLDINDSHHNGDEEQEHQIIPTPDGIFDSLDVSTRRRVLLDTKLPLSVSSSSLSQQQPSIFRSDHSNLSQSLPNSLSTTSPTNTTTTSSLCQHVHDDRKPSSLSHSHSLSDMIEWQNKLSAIQTHPKVCSSSSNNLTDVVVSDEKTSLLLNDISKTGIDNDSIQEEQEMHVSSSNLLRSKPASSRRSPNISMINNHPYREPNRSLKNLNNSNSSSDESKSSMDCFESDDLDFSYRRVKLSNLDSHFEDDVVGPHLPKRKSRSMDMMVSSLRSTSSPHKRRRSLGMPDHSVDIIVTQHSFGCGYTKE